MTTTAGERVGKRFSYGTANRLACTFRLDPVVTEFGHPPLRWGSGAGSTPRWALERESPVQERVPGKRPDDAINDEAGRLLEAAHGSVGFRAEDAVDLEAL